MIKEHNNEIKNNKSKINIFGLINIVTIFHYILINLQNFQPLYKGERS
jgi:hypothetical protein